MKLPINKIAAKVNQKNRLAIGFIADQRGKTRLSDVIKTVAPWPTFYPPMPLFNSYKRTYIVKRT